jgi:transcription initiation factor TFIID TATA-box-binding protein
MVQAQNQA